MHKNDAERARAGSAAVLPVLVLALCFAFNFIGRGVGDTYMVFLLPLGAEFGWHRSQMTSVYSALMVVSGLASPLSGIVFERWGPRVLYAGGLALLGAGYYLAGQAQTLWQFYLCIGLLGGLGASAIGMVPAAALISRWFDRRMSTAIGLAYAGFGCGALLMVPLAQTLIDSRGWRDAYHLIGGTLLLLLPLSLTLPWGRIRAGSAALPPPVARSGAGMPAPLRAALGQRRFWLLVQVMFFTATGMYLIIVQSVAYLVDIGFTPLQAAGAFGSAGMLSVIGVSAAGWLADRYGHKRAATVSFTGTFLGTVVLFVMSFQSTHWLLGAYVLLFGLCQGARGPVIASLSARLFPGPGQAAIYGAIYACMSVGSGLGALLSGVLHDLSGGYRASFVLAMACVIAAAAPFWTSRILIPAERPAP
ncbi:MAG: MFS transporter [Rubrivivax sp.]|nr:MFS transporter [Rubrivivax sp.]